MSSNIFNAVMVLLKHLMRRNLIASNLSCCCQGLPQGAPAPPLLHQLRGAFGLLWGIGTAYEN